MTKNELSWYEFEIKQIKKAIEYIDNPVYGPDFAKGYLRGLVHDIENRYNEYKKKLEKDVY